MRVPLKDANDAKSFLIRNDLMDFSRTFDKDKRYIYFPIKKKVATKTDFRYTIIERELAEKPIQESFKEAVKKHLSKDELELLKTSYDAVGDIAILEIDDELRKKEKLIAETLLESNAAIKTVLRKSGSHFGVFRTQKMIHLAGEKKKETVHKENDIELKLDVEKVYFSVRLSTERKRVAQQVKTDERILVLFSGCAPYPCVLAKNAEPKYVCGVEINPDGHRYGLENVKRNKLKNVYLSNRDAKKTEKILKDFKDIPDFDPHFDRILMPLPKSAADFLDAALFFAKKDTIIHFYDFLHEDEFEQAHQKIKEACERHLMGHEIIETVKCGQHAPHIFRICVDFRVF